MHRVVTVTVPASVTALTTVARVKEELSIRGTGSDALLLRKSPETAS